MIIAHWGESHLVNVQCKHMNRWYHRLSHSGLLSKIRTTYQFYSRIILCLCFLNSVDFRADGGMIYCLYFVMLTLCGDYTLLNGKAGQHEKSGQFEEEQLSSRKGQSQNGESKSLSWWELGPGLGNDIWSNLQSWFQTLFTILPTMNINMTDLLKQGWLAHCMKKIKTFPA